MRKTFVDVGNDYVEVGRSKSTEKEGKSNNKRPRFQGVVRNTEQEVLIRNKFESKKLQTEASEDLLPSYDKRRAKFRREKLFRLHKNPTSKMRISHLNQCPSKTTNAEVHQPLEPESQFFLLFIRIMKY